MVQSFRHSAESLQAFFSQAGRGFYVPYYQRNYSWDAENAGKLVDDVLSGIKRTLTKPDNSVFLGTVILHDEKNLAVGVHVDTPNLMTKVSNVVDGQQRITSIAMLAAVLSYWCSDLKTKLRSYNPPIAELGNLANELDNAQLDLREFFSVQINRLGAQPPLKPIIIRAGDVTSNPVSDQWTLDGAIPSFYRSNTSHFLAEFINGIAPSSIQVEDRIESILEAFNDRIQSAINSADFQFASSLLQANGHANGSLVNFMAYPPGLQSIQSRPADEQSTFYGAMLLLAACSFLKNACHLVVIECQDEALAFDMFQSLNATGTPLTAFEVFKPLVVKTWGTNYAHGIKPQVDRIESVFETKSTAGEKEALTDRVIVSSALAYNGKEISSRFSDERDWLFSAMPASVNTQATDLLTCIADQAEYCLQSIVPRRSPRNSASFGLVQHLLSLGLTLQQADIAALCTFYLRDAGHQFAHSVLSIFYSKLLRAQSNSTNAAAEFVSVCKATAAFFTLWMGASRGRFPDDEYRALFQSAIANISILSGSINQTALFVKDAFKTALEKKVAYNAANAGTARQLWVANAKETAWYLRKAVCRFALFATADNGAPDLTAGNEGLFVNGMPNSANFLNCRAWHSSDFEVIEHVATRDRPANIKFPNYFDSTIYPGNSSVVDKIGNLTLLSVKVNSSVYSEWPDKVFYYWSLTTPNSTVAGPTGTALMSALGITTLPPSMSSLSVASNYLPQLAPLAYRGQKGLPWDTAFINVRSQHLCERLFDKIDPWLR
jgi:Protein of unknown function DUF262